MGKIGNSNHYHVSLLIQYFCYYYAIVINVDTETKEKNKSLQFYVTTVTLTVGTISPIDKNKIVL